MNPPSLETRSERSLRRSAKLVALPLMVALVLPWNIQHAWMASWELAEYGAGFFVLPALGAIFGMAAYHPGLTLQARRRMLGVAGLAAFVVGLSLLSSPASHDAFRIIGNSGVLGTYLFFGAWCLAAGGEIAMHQRPGSRALAGLAAVGWLAALLALWVPVGSHGDFDESLLGAMVTGIDRGTSRSTRVLVVLTPPIALMFVGLVQALRRLGKDRDKAGGRFFRTSWIAYLLLPTPLIVSLMLVLATGNNALEIATSVFNGFALVFGALFGGAIGIGHGVCALAPTEFRVPSWVKKAAMGVGALGALLWLVSGLFPEHREGRIAAMAWEMAEATTDALEGKTVDPRFLGGYAEFDLRSAGGVLPEGIELEPVLYALRVEAVEGHRRAAAYMVVLPGGEVRWAGASHQREGITSIERLSDTSPALADLVTRTLEGSESLRCLEGLTSAELAAMPASARNILGRPASDICEGDQRGNGRVRTFRDNSDGSGAINEYLLVLRSPEGELVTVTGSHRFDTGLLWIGAPHLVPDP